MRHKTIRPIVLVLLLLLATATAVSPAAPRISEDQQINHVLNRLGFGARPGDVDRVQKLGIREYIERQLNPDRISDTVVEEKVAGFTSLKMDRSDLLEEYPNPQQLARKLGIRNPNQPNNSTDPNANQKQQAAARAKLQTYMKDNMLQRPQQLLQDL